jgi:surfactin synthase thioesterase subunit
VTAAGRPFARRAERNPWLPWQGQGAGAGVRLYGLPHAGGSAIAYRAWIDALLPDVDFLPIELPGHGVRYGEAPVVDIGVLADLVIDQVLAAQPGAFALFGHSMGAAVAYEVAVRLERAEAANRPRHLLLSAVRPPGEPPPKSLHDLPDDELLTELERLDGTRPEVLRNREVMRAMLPGLRADLGALARWQVGQGTPVRCAITALGGSTDTIVPPATLTAWRRLALGGFRQRVLPGSHFYFTGDPEALMREIRVSLAACGRPTWGSGG